MKQSIERLIVNRPKVGGVFFIAIDGHGGSGKSTLAKLMAKELKAEIIRVDDFADWDNPHNWWPRVIEQVFSPIKAGVKTLSYQPSSWWKDHQPSPITDKPVTNLMILEGLGSSRSQFDDFISLRIFVDTPRELCITRGVERDMGNGKSKEDLTILWMKWLSEEDEYFNNDNPKAKADYVVDGIKPYEEQLALMFGTEAKLV